MSHRIILFAAVLSLFFFGCGTSGSPTLPTSGSPTPPAVNVLDNAYGISLIADRLTDNCTAWANFQAAVPDYTTAYFPQGTYYVNPVTCPSGFVLTRHISILGESSGEWDGSNINNATVFLNPITLNLQGGTSVRSIAIDARNGVLDANDGISSGAAATSAGGTTVEDVLYVGSAANWFSHPVHGVLLQSGPNNTVQNIRVYYAFHGVAIRASNTVVSNIKTWDVIDVIVKAYNGSGNANNNTLNGLEFDGDSGQGGGLFFTAQSLGVEDADNVASNITCHNSPYCLVFEADSGGQMSSIAVSNVTAQDGGNGIYAYFGDGNLSNSIGFISINNVQLSNLSGNGILNYVASSFCVSNFSPSSILGATILGIVNKC